MCIRDRHGAGARAEKFYSRERSCLSCRISFPELEPQHFSFNSRHGACPQCSGYGVRIAQTRELEHEEHLSEVAEEAVRFVELPEASGASEACEACRGARLK